MNILLVICFIMAAVTGVSIAIAISYYIDNKDLKLKIKNMYIDLMKCRRRKRKLEDERTQLIADLDGWSENGVIMNNHILHLEQKLRNIRDGKDS